MKSGFIYDSREPRKARNIPLLPVRADRPKLSILNTPKAVGQGQAIEMLAKLIHNAGVGDA